MNYRDVYRKNFGDIPVDETGRPYDIHHIDGNHFNNTPSNLKAVSISDHFDIHFQRKEYNACLLIAKRMNKPYSELVTIQKLCSDLMKTNNPSARAKGINHWSRDTVSVVDSKGNKFRVHRSDQRIGHELLSLNKGKITVKDSNGKCFHVTKDDPRYISGEVKHVTAGLVLICPHCNKTGGNSMKRWHFNNCRNRVEISINQ